METFDGGALRPLQTAAVHVPVISCVLFTPFRQSVEHEEIVVFCGIINRAKSSVGHGAW